MHSGQLFYLLAGLAAAVADDTSSTQADQSSASATPTFDVEIPDTKGNPFIHTTTLPEGTLFIIFGSVLLAIIVALIVWRVTSVIMMRRTIKRGGQFQTLENTYGGPFVDPVADGDGTELPPTIDKKAESRNRDKQIRQSMFFSPTAQVMNSGNVSQPMVASSYLPAGYYSQPQTSDTSSQRRPYSVAGSMRAPSIAVGSTADNGRRVRQRPPSMMLDELISREQNVAE
ncbi:hypothetical protein B9G98_03911 [Wickerhamiella sorbophila]|uniref:Vacuolar membrane protein n=1 Tax=Wickerhamiella sorbophila TaxID=45607 RepID=A0A2T0FMS5_9ASCO|nr:hypothetical protein B9G98_03911 [Wickerhamiella sorbophila]PRT56291.1 hypothetical protein B9G98_03911 [Wickerhamiella sorbophila]